MKPKEFDIGLSDYRKSVLTNKYIVDKSMFIKEFLKSQRQVVLIPRPRRFGKTFNMSMLHAFFDCSTNDNIELFKESKIYKETEIINSHCGKYPVISLTFKDVKADNWTSMQNKLRLFFQKNFIRFKYLLKSDKIDEDYKEFFLKIQKGKVNIDNCTYALELLIKMLYDFYGKEVIVLIDEYDAPIHSAYINNDESGNFYKSTVEFIRDLFSGAFKDNPRIFKSCITGILKVSKESIFSGLNNVLVFSILNDYFSTSFGLTQNEVNQICENLNLKDKQDDIKHWYNGYYIGNKQNIYNPWSVLNYVSMPQSGFDLYWNNSSSNQLPQALISETNAVEIRDNIAKLIQGNTIKTKIDKYFVFPNLHKKPSLFWTLMLLTGYLTFVGKEDEEFILKIPNNEVLKIFTNIIDNWLQIYLGVSENSLNILSKSLLNRNIVLFERKLNETMVSTLSYFDLQDANEQIYQVYMIALLSVLQSDYFVKSNRESGDGRYDILLLPKKADLLGIILELKVIKAQRHKESDEDFEERIKKTQKAALKQIDDKRYLTELKEHNIPESNILQCAVVFSGKKAYVLEQ